MTDFFVILRNYFFNFEINFLTKAQEMVCRIVSFNKNSVHSRNLAVEDIVIYLNREMLLSLEMLLNRC